MEDNYYIPKIEDFHIGYEYEYYIMTVWQKVAFHPSDFAYAENWLENLDKRLIRVPYLTKEQIINEGWEESQDWNYDEKHFYKLGVSLTLIIGYMNQEIISYEIIINDDIKGILFRGECPSVNEFKLICKLLNIK